MHRGFSHRLTDFGAHHQSLHKGAIVHQVRQSAEGNFSAQVVRGEQGVIVAHLGDIFSGRLQLVAQDRERQVFRFERLLPARIDKHIEVPGFTLGMDHRPVLF